MRISELCERHLPLAKGVVRHARSRYMALIATMSPQDFIRLTTEGPESYDRIFSQTKVDLDTYRSGSDPDYNRESYSMPFLTVQIENGLVKEHEGRHRAAMVARAGGTTFPVGIMFCGTPRYIITYEKTDYSNWDGEDESQIGRSEEEETYGTWAEAEARETELKALAKDLDSPVYYSRIDINSVGGGTMKGSPRSPAYNGGDNWTYSPWEVSDMPKQLIGQFDASVVVSTSTMRVGLVKGYRHYRS